MPKSKSTPRKARITNKGQKRFSLFEAMSSGRNLTAHDFHRTAVGMQIAGEVVHIDPTWISSVSSWVTELCSSIDALWVIPSYRRLISIRLVPTFRVLAWQDDGTVVKQELLCSSITHLPETASEQLLRSGREFSLATDATVAAFGLAGGCLVWVAGIRRCGDGTILILRIFTPAGEHACFVADRIGIYPFNAPPAFDELVYHSVCSSVCMEFANPLDIETTFRGLYAQVLASYSHLLNLPSPRSESTPGSERLPPLERSSEDDEVEVEGEGDGDGDGDFRLPGLSEEQSVLFSKMLPHLQASVEQSFNDMITDIVQGQDRLLQLAVKMHRQVAVVEANHASKLSNLRHQMEDRIKSDTSRLTNIITKDKERQVEATRRIRTLEAQLATGAALSPPPSCEIPTVNAPTGSRSLRDAMRQLF